jgi:xanthine dehydrogenase iron-sulfur cluster and FAD-binding subunit A
VQKSKEIVQYACIQEKKKSKKEGCAAAGCGSVLSPKGE